jgi:tetratricopeptide (TPR) repeat protein
MENLASNLLTAGIMEIIGDKVDQVALRKSGHYSLLSYCYRTEAEKDLIAKQLSTHPTIMRALAYYDKLLVLAPKSSQVYSSLHSIYELTGDTTALQALHERLLAAHLDPLRDRKEINEYLDAKNDERFHKSITTEIQFLNGVIDGKQTKVSPLTSAVAMAELVSYRLRSTIFGDQVSFDELVTMAEKAEAIAPSFATRNTLMRVLFSRAIRHAADEKPTMATLISKYQRISSSSELIVLACADIELRKMLSADQDVKRAVALFKDAEKDQPHSPQIGLWALLNGLGDPDVTACAEAISRDRNGDMSSQIELNLSPLTATAVISQWWRHCARGDTVGASAVLTTAHEREVILPPLVH